MIALLAFWGVLAGVCGFGWLASKLPLPQRETPDLAAGYPEAAAFALTALADPMWAAQTWRLLGLASPQAGAPTLHRVTPTKAGVLLELVMPMGQAVSDWQDRAEKIAGALVVPRVRVVDMGSGDIGLELVLTDPLRPPAPARVSVRGVDLLAVSAGVREDGDLWRVQVLYRHILIAGASDAGKSGVLWALLAGMAPAIRDGLVEVWAIDPMRVELSPGRALFARYVGGVDENALALLTELEAVMEERLSRMEAAGLRKHVPTADEPLIVAPIDEVLVLTAFAPDKEFGAETDRRIRTLAAVGRKAAISLILLGQDPSKEIMAFRQMMTMRIALRMTEDNQTAMVLGQGAREQGVNCKDIPETTPGVAWVGENGRAGFTRVRAFHVSDADIATLLRAYAPSPRPVDPTAFEQRPNSPGGNDFPDPQGEAA